MRAKHFMAMFVMGGAACLCAVCYSMNAALGVVEAVLIFGLAAVVGFDSNGRK